MIHCCCVAGVAPKGVFGGGGWYSKKGGRGAFHINCASFWKKGEKNNSDINYCQKVPFIYTTLYRIRG